MGFSGFKSLATSLIQYTVKSIDLEGLGQRILGAAQTSLPEGLDREDRSGGTGSKNPRYCLRGLAWRDWI